MVYGTIFGRMVLCIILGLILISSRRVWILTLKGLMAFALFSNKIFEFYFHDADIGRVLWA